MRKRGREGEGERERKIKERGRERNSGIIFVSSALELHAAKQGKMEDSRDIFKLAAQTEILVSTIASSG